MYDIKHLLIGQLVEQNALLTQQVKDLQQQIKDLQDKSETKDKE